MKSVRAVYVEKLKRGPLDYRKRNALLIHLHAQFWLNIGNVVDPAGTNLSPAAPLGKQRQRVSDFGRFSPEDLRRSQQAMACFLGVKSVDFSLHFRLRHWFADLLTSDQCCYIDVMICACREFIRLEMGCKQREDYHSALWGERKVAEFYGDEAIRLVPRDDSFPDSSFSGAKRLALAASAYEIYRDQHVFESYFKVEGASSTRENALWASKPIFDELDWDEFGYDVYVFSCLLDNLVKIFLDGRPKARLQGINRSSQ